MIVDQNYYILNFVEITETILKGADLAANSLSSLGIKYVFGMSGSSISGMLDSIYQSDSDVEFIGIRHENAAAFMADAYSRVTHLPSACAFQWGPGAANSMLGVATAYRDNSPIMIITGETPTDRVGREGFHEWNQVGVFNNVTKWSHTPRSPKEIPWTFKTAYSRAIGGNPGPVHINLPGDVLSKEFDGTEPKISPISRETFRTRPNPDLVRKALEVILSARQPVIIVGSGVIWSAASAESPRVCRTSEHSRREFFVSTRRHTRRSSSISRSALGSRWAYNKQSCCKRHQINRLSHLDWL